MVAAPPPAPTPTPLALNGPSAPTSFTNGGGGSLQVSPVTASGVQVTITDPDTLSPAAIGDTNFDGDETISISVAGGAPITLGFVRQEQTFGSAVPLSSWSASTAATATDQARNYSLAIYKPVVGTAGQTATSRYATVAVYGDSVTRSSATNYQVLGAPTAAADMPANFSARYEGVAIGDQMTAKATITVSSAGGASQVAGLINNPVSVASYPAGWQVQFSGAVSGSGFSGPATLSATGQAATTGTVTGAFYGPKSNAAAEVAGVWSIPNLATPPLGAAGAFVAAK